MCEGLDPEHTFDTYPKCLMRSGLYPFFHIALLSDFGSFALWMSDNLFESAHCSTASPLSVVVYPQRVLWLVEISYYDVRLDSLSQWRELEWFRWWFVQGVFNDTWKLDNNEFNILLFTYRNAVHL